MLNKLKDYTIMKRYSRIYPGIELKYNIKEIQILEDKYDKASFVEKEDILKKINNLMDIDVINGVAFGEKFPKYL